MTNGNFDGAPSPGEAKAIRSPRIERSAKDGEARGLRVTCHRFPRAKLAEAFPSPRAPQNTLIERKQSFFVRM